jgi:phytanoyl-CoA hydroxylase
MLRDAIAHWRRHGWARLGVVADAGTLAGLRARAEAIMQGQVTHEGLFFQHDAGTGRYEDLEFGRGWVGPSDAYRKIEKLERDPVFHAWIESPALEPVVRAIVGPDVSIYRATLFTKSARGGTELPWHQDGGSFWGLDRDPELQIWTALDEAPKAAGCVEVVPRSHRAGLATPNGGVVPRNIVDVSDAEATAQALPARAGEAILIHNYAWHRSGVNMTDAPRRALSICYMAGATRCLRKRRAPRTFPRVFAGGRQ